MATASDPAAARRLAERQLARYAQPWIGSWPPCDGEDAFALATALLSALDEAERAREMLREVEWHGRCRDGSGEIVVPDDPVCAFCRGNRAGGHYAHCRLAAFLAAPPAEGRA